MIIDIRDRGTDSIAKLSNTDYIDLQDIAELENAIEYLRLENHKYKSVAVDTITQLQQMMLEEYLSQKGKDKKQAGNWGSMSMRDWGVVSTNLRYMLSRIKDLPIHSCFLAQERVDSYDDDSDVDGVLAPEVGPRIMGSVAAEINANASVVGSTFIRQKKTRNRVRGKLKVDTQTQFCMRIAPNPVYVTKIRTPKEYDIPEFIVDPTFRKLTQAIKGDFKNA